MTTHLVICTAQSTVTATPQTAFVVIAPIDLTRIFTGFPFIPAVIDVDDNPTTWDTPGQVRYPLLSDGSRLNETLKHYDKPSSFGYEISGFTGLFGELIDLVDGTWEFTQIDDATTNVRWSYAFVPKPKRELFVQLLVRPYFRLYMNHVLRAACREVQSESTK